MRRCATPNVALAIRVMAQFAGAIHHQTILNAALDLQEINQFAMKLLATKLKL
jgi:hypothetical protein